MKKSNATPHPLDWCYLDIDAAKAYKKYAEQLQKPESALSDEERKTAFAIACYEHLRRN